MNKKTHGNEKGKKKNISLPTYIGITFTILATILLLLFVLTSNHLVHTSTESTLSNYSKINVDEMNLIVDHEWLTQLSKGEQNDNTMKIHRYAESIKTITNAQGVVWVDFSNDSEVVTVGDIPQYS